MNDRFEYKVSVIIPIYNSEKYLEDCFNSLLLQTIDPNDMEILLINDGSTDRSLEICNRFASYYPVFKVFSHENAGVSATRNEGIRNAKGKYIMYLDSDDELTEDTLKKVVDFFDAHYDDVDIVTYPERTYLSNGEMRKPHLRYNTLKSTGIYDAQKDVFLYQVRLNVAVKNLGENNVYFDEEMGYHEDQKYCNDIIRDKLKLGFVDGCEYKYKLRDGNITGENTNPLCLFEPTTHYWEEMFASFPDEVPEYYQALLVHDMSWKLSQNCLLPYHYKGEQFETACNRLWKLLERVDVDLIMKHPSLDNFHRFFFLEKKKAVLTPVVTAKDFSLVSEQKRIYHNTQFELIHNKCKVFGNEMLMQCTLKSQFFNFFEQPEIYVRVNGSQMTKLKSWHSPMSYYKCKTITNYFWGFYFTCDLSEVREFEFLVCIDGYYFPTKYYFMPTSPFVFNKSIVRGDYILSALPNGFKVKKADEAEREALLKQNNMAVKKERNDVYSIRKISECFANQKIWIYYDCKGVVYDNGYLQFMHDFDKQDGVQRYYILNNDFEESKHLFEERHLPYVVPFGSELHKHLFIRASKIITAFIEEVNIYAFNAADKKYYMDLMNAKIVYLQHGILHATLPWKYTPERIEIDEVVASSNFEINSFTGKYCFRKQDVLPYGMPRFEKLDKNGKSVNRILYAPSWRMYLIGQCVDTVWNLTDSKFVGSNYFKETQRFLNSEELHKVLEENDLYLDFKIHPIFRPYLKHFTITSDRVSIADNMVNDEEYKMFITDFSSYVFNFAYLEKPILYFVPDMPEFSAGLNQYRELDLPFEEGFGEFVETAEEAVKMVEKTIRNNFRSEDKYDERIKTFFLEINNCCEKIYNHIVNE